MFHASDILKRIWFQKDLIWTLVANDVKGKYFGSVVGLWASVINPLVLLSIYCLVFSGILKIKFGSAEGTGNFAIYLFCGLVPWMGFSESVQRACTVMLDQRALIKRVPFAKEILPFYLTMSTFFTALVALIIFVGVLLIIGETIGARALLLPILFPLQILFAYGLSLAAASLHVFFRDIGVFLGSILHVWFFCTPVFYPESLIPARFMPFMQLNPLFHLVRAYRQLLLENALPDLRGVIYFAAAAFLSFLIGCRVFYRVRNRIVDYL